MNQQNNEKLRVGVIQMCSGRMVESNLADASCMIREAASKGAQYILTPEDTLLVELEPEIIRFTAQPLEDNSALAAFRALARELSVWLHIGSIAVVPENRDKEDQHLVNRSCLISPKGKITAYYDKIHLFDVNLANGEAYRESDTFDPGQRAVVADLDLDGHQAKLGFTICYDLRFPHLFNILARAGAQIITVPSAFTRQTGKAHWHILLRARAIETGCYILAAAQGGRHDAGRSTYGHSLIIDPWGEILAQAPGDSPQIIMAELDLAKVEQVRRRIPSLTHERLFGINPPRQMPKIKGVS